MDLTTGTKIDGRYIIDKLIGEGGMANVYLAQDIILNRTVAIKVLHAQLAKQERFVERFRREAEAVASLVHPNIVDIYDVGQYGECYFIVMELLEGTTLKEYIKSKKHLSVSEAIMIMKQSCDAVSLAHQYGIVHRDLKPQNIFILNNGQVKIMDFGIAYQQDATPLTQTNAVMGSVHYLSPEQAKGEAATVQTDIYSLGIVMYEMLVGEVPFSGDSAVNIVLKHLREPVPYVSEKNMNVPQSVENIVIRATAKNPADRYQTLYEMKDDLDTCLNVEKMNEPRVYFEPFQDEAISEEIEKLEHAEEEILEDENQELTNAKKKKKIAMIASGVVATLLAGIVIFAMLFNSSNKITTMPDVINKTLPEATSILEQQELKVGKVEYVASETIEKGKIISTNHPTNDKIDKGTAVDLKISKGKVIPMINTVGQDIEAVKTQLDSLGIKYKIETKASDEAENTVLSQSIAEGKDVVLADDTVNLVVAIKEEFALINVTGYSLAQVEAYASEKGLELEIVEYAYSDSVRKDYVISMPNWYAGKMVKKGDVIQIIISKGEEPKKPIEKPSTSPVEEDN